MMPFSLKNFYTETSLCSPILFYRIPCRVGGLEEVFRAIVNRLSFELFKLRTEFFREEVIVERRKGMSCTLISGKWEGKNTYLVMPFTV
jgi:hypothetical protein